MNDALDFTLKLPNLKELTQIRIARSLWNDIDENEPRITTQDRVKLKISLLPIPKAIQKDLETYVHFIDDQIYYIRDRFFSWDRRRQFELDNIQNNFLNNWTAYATISICHLAELLIGDDRLPVSYRYVIACEFCYQDDIARLWDVMKPAQFHQKMLKTIFKNCSILVYYWSCIMKGKPRRFNTFPGMPRHLSAEEYVFKMITTPLSQNECNELSLKYFWDKMAEMEQRGRIQELKVAVATTELSGYVDPNALLYLLSQMGFEDQLQTLKSCPVMFLKCFLNRPCQHLFFPTLDLVYGCKSLTDYLPWFLSRISLEQCDETMRRRFFDSLRPLFAEHVYDHNQTVRFFRNKLSDCRHEYTLEVMRDATQDQKLDFIMEAYDFFRDVDGLNSVTGLVVAWVTRDHWPDLKEKMKKNSQQSVRDSTLQRFKIFSESLDEYYSSLENQNHVT